MNESKKILELAGLSNEGEWGRLGLSKMSKEQKGLANFIVSEVDKLAKKHADPKMGFLWGGASIHISKDGKGTLVIKQDFQGDKEDKTILQKLVKSITSKYGKQCEIYDGIYFNDSPGSVKDIVNLVIAEG